MYFTMKKNTFFAVYLIHVLLGSIPRGSSLPLAEEPTIPTPLSFDVRLKESDVFWIGILEIRGDGIWKPVCRNSWSKLDSKTACRSMGFTDVLDEQVIEKRIILDDVRCDGDEDDIFDCRHTPLFRHDCRHYEDAGVTCDPGSETSEPPSPRNSTIRLQDGGEFWEGRVEIFYDGFWNTICDDYWDISDARVFCRMLGYNDAQTAHSRNEFPDVSTTIQKTNLRCAVWTESKIESCSFQPSTTSCYEQVIVTCSPPTEREERVRLVEFPDDWEVIVEARAGSSWYAICDDGWDMSAGEVVCRMLGYERAVGAYIGLNSNASNSYILDDIACDGNETDIMDCDHGPLLEHDCTQEEHAGVSCLPDLRLAGGEYSSSGIVEVFHNDSWETLCLTSDDKNEAYTICSTLGYDSFTFIEIDLDNKVHDFSRLRFTCARSDSIAECFPYLIPDSEEARTCSNAESVLGVNCSPIDPCEEKECPDGSICVESGLTSTWECLAFCVTVPRALCLYEDIEDECSWNGEIPFSTSENYHSYYYSTSASFSYNDLTSASFPGHSWSSSSTLSTSPENATSRMTESSESQSNSAPSSSQSPSINSISDYRHSRLSGSFSFNSTGAEIPKCLYNLFLPNARWFVLILNGSHYNPEHVEIKVYKGYEFGRTDTVYISHAHNQAPSYLWVDYFSVWIEVTSITANSTMDIDYVADCKQDMLHTSDQCNFPLGMEATWIGNDQITASSRIDRDHAAHHARLYGPSAWMPDPSDTEPFIEISLDEDYEVTGLVIQGGGGDNRYWVKAFSLEYGVQGEFVYILDPYKPRNSGTNIQLFEGNSEYYCAKYINHLPPGLITDRLRLRPIQETPIALRLEVLGCRPNECNVSESSYDESPILYTQRLQHGDRSFEPGNETSRHWSTDYSEPRTITRIVSRKCLGLDGLSQFDLMWTDNPGTNSSSFFVRSKLRFQYRGTPWAQIEFNPPITNVYHLRIYPTKWTGNEPCLQIKVFGCPTNDMCNKRLGMESLDIPDENIKCSGCDEDSLSVVRLNSFGENLEIGCFFRPNPAVDPSQGTNEPPLLQVRFPKRVLLSGMILQSGSPGYPFDEDFDKDKFTYNVIMKHQPTTASSDMVFLQASGVHEFYARSYAQKTIMFGEDYLTTAVQLIPVIDTYRQSARFSVEFLGCPTDAKCKNDNSYFNGECFNFADAIRYNSNTCPNGSPDYGSRLAYIKSQPKQTFLKELASSSLPPHYLVRMGMEFRNSALQWLDGSEVVFKAFSEAISPEDDLYGQCGFMDPANCYQWRMEDCSAQTFFHLCEADFNECLDTSSNNCAEICVNMEHTFYCKCPRGMRMTTDTECQDLCEVINSTSASLDGGTVPMCVYVGRTNWDQATRECSKKHLGRFATPEELFNYSDSLNEESWWTIEEGTRKKCVSFSLLSREADQVDCEMELNFLCVTEYHYIQLEDEDLTSLNNNFTASLGYLGFSAHLNTVAYDQSFYVQVDDSLYLRLTFSLVSLREQTGGGGDCLDYVSVEDLVQTNAESRKICGNYKDITFFMSHHIRINVFAQSIFSLIQFSMIYEAIDCKAEQISCESGCGTTELIYDGTYLGTQPFPSSFIPFSSCETNVTVSDQSFIQLTIDNYAFAIGSDGVCQDRVTLTSPDHALTFSCDASHVPHLILTNSSTMTVAIDTGRESVSKGLQARVNASDVAGCAVGTDSESQNHQCTFSPGIIASRLYPKYIAVGMKETWLLQAPSNAFIELVFDVLRLSDEGDCSTSSIEVIDSERPSIPIASFCSGEDAIDDGMVVETDVNSVKVEVVTSQTETVKFLAHYRFVRVEGDEENWEVSNTTMCPDGWVLYRGHCYLFARVKNSTWAEAEEYCTHQPNELSDTHMVSILDEREARFIHSLLVLQWSYLGQRIYIGLGERNSASMFRWTNGSPMTYTDWFSPRSYEEEEKGKQPDGGSIEKCTIIDLTRIRFSSLWHDIPCASDTADAVICKMEASTSTRPTSRKRRQTSELVLFSAPSMAPNCSYNTFECGSGECVQRVFQYDEEHHCNDGSVEEASYGGYVGDCLTDQFKCLSGGRCISISFVCDHINDCRDGSDEFDCIFPSECRDGEFFCSDFNKCIDTSKRCNLVVDCPTAEGGDELNCRDEYEDKGNVQCYSGTWLPSYAKCDGLVDCIGNGFEDETSCGFAPCNDPDEFRCLSGVCINTSHKCIFDLDELGYVKGCRDVSHLRDSVCADFECPAYHYKCPSSYCIPLRYRCDSINQCPYGEEETGCGDFNFNSIQPEPCPSRSYKCRTYNKCVAPYEMCDGIKHCPQGDDELFCDVVCPSECDCTGLTMRCDFVSTKGHVRFPHNTRKIVISLNYDVQLELRAELNLSTFTRSMNETGDNRAKTVSFWPSDYIYLVELDISNTDLKEIPEKAFLETRNLRNLNVSMNSELAIEAAVLYNLTRLSVFDIFEINIKSSDAEVAEAFKTLVNLKRLKTDEFGFCCLAPKTALCDGYTNQFSSCDDLLKDVSLRAFMWILGLSALVGNALALGARFVRRKQAGQNRIQVMFITHLAVSDLLMGLYMIIIAGADSHYRGKYALHAQIWTSSITCKMAGFLSVLSSEVSVLLVMLISIDRFLSVVFPLKNDLHLTIRSAYILVIASWTFSLLLSIIPALPVEYFREFYGKSSVCLALPLTSDRLPGSGWEYSIVVFICTNFICFMLTFLCYFVIYISVRRSHLRIKSLGAASNSMMKEQMQLTTKMALVVGTDFVCWMPIIIMGILASSNLVQIPADIYAWTAVFILPLNSALNPYLYTLSTVLQRRRKARENTDSMSLTQTTTHGVVLTQREERLLDYCIIPHTSLKQHKRIEPITTFLTRWGGTLDERQERLMVRDLRRALCHLRTLGADDRELIAANVVVERDLNGAVARALFVMTNPLDISRFVGPSGSNGIQTKLSALFDQIQDPLMTPVKKFHDPTAESFAYQTMDEGLPENLD